MSSKCNNEQSKRDGSSQLSRFLKALDPANAPLDDRSVEDILVFAKHYASLVRFYDKDEDVDWAVATGSYERRGENDKGGDQNGKPIHDWKEFFYSDIAVLIASIAGYKNKLKDIKFDYDDRRKQTDQNPNIPNYRDLFLSIIQLMQRV